MADKNLFKTFVGKMIPQTNALNHEGAPAYQMEPKAALAQLAATGCLNSTFYASAGTQLETVLELCREVEPDFAAQTAIYSREKALMKDMPALICADLSVRGPEQLERVFDRVIDNGKMLKNFVQIMRSGVVGRKSLGSRPKRLVRRWLASRSDEALFRSGVGADPSLADIVKMVHPKPASRSREALYGYLIGREHDQAMLPDLVRRYEAYKETGLGDPPRVPFEMLTSLPLDREAWRGIARNAGWQMTRMNLNTFARHGVYEDQALVDLIAARLRNRSEIAKARVFPYQLLAAYRRAEVGIPASIRDALQDAMEIATENTPRISGKLVVCPDVSGSMTWASATGYRRGSTSAVRCIDVAALVAATLVRKNPGALVLPFENDVVKVRLNGRDSIMTNAERLARVGGGGTNLSAPLVRLNRRKIQADLVVFVSDNQSWLDARHGPGTRTLREWNGFRKRNPKARMVCLDIQPYADTQAPDRADILNVGGFSDHVFKVIDWFAAGVLGSGHWVGEIEKIEL